MVKLGKSLLEIDKRLAETESQYYIGVVVILSFTMNYLIRVILMVFVAWGGLNSIENIERRAYHYGIKIIDNGPKISF